jgi:hypothetical protein
MQQTHRREKMKNGKTGSSLPPTFPPKQQFTAESELTNMVAQYAQSLATLLANNKNLQVALAEARRELEQLKTKAPKAEAELGDEKQTSADEEKRP